MDESDKRSGRVKAYRGPQRTSPPAEVAAATARRISTGDEPETMCLYPGCTRLMKRDGLCGRCLAKLVAGSVVQKQVAGECVVLYHEALLIPDKRRAMRQSRRRVCSIRGCDRTVKARGLCHKHYQQARVRAMKHGDWGRISLTVAKGRGAPAKGGAGDNGPY